MTFTTSYSKNNVVCCKHGVTLASLRLTAVPVFDLSGICTRTTNWFVYIFGIGDILGHCQVRSPRMRRRNVELAYYTSIASIITPDYFKTCLYRDDPLSGRQRVGRSLKPPLVGVVTVQRSLFTHVACSNAVRCLWFLWLKSWKSRNFSVILAVLTCLPLIKSKDIVFR